jgi:hypothetical protein
VDAEDDEVEIVVNLAFDFERLESYPPTVLNRASILRPHAQKLRFAR